MSAEMLLSRPRMNAYITARLALARADQNLGAEFAGSDEAFAKYIFRGHHAVAVAALRWLCAVLHGQDVASDFSVVSATQLPLKNRTPHWFSVALAEGSGVQIRLHPQRKGKAAGGRLCIDEVHPAIQKKGPDSWQVDVQVLRGLHAHMPSVTHRKAIVASFLALAADDHTLCWDIPLSARCEARHLLASRRPS